jgi:hypothetical protein
METLAAVILESEQIHGIWKYRENADGENK